MLYSSDEGASDYNNSEVVADERERLDQLISPVYTML
jgi:hypothetical protein